MNESKVRALFELVDLPIINLHRLENQYWPDSPNYYEIKAKSPWWLVKTEYGDIVIGWRKRVIEINWKDLGIAFIATTDNVTKEDTYVHAWSYVKALEYLTNLVKHLTR